MKFSFFIFIILSAFTITQAQEVHSSEFYSRISDVEMLSDSSYVIATMSGNGEFYNYGRIEWIENGLLARTINLPYYCNDLQFHNTEEGIRLDVWEHGECDVIYSRFFSILLDTLTKDQIWNVDQNYNGVWNAWDRKRFQDSIFVELSVESSIDPTQLAGFFDEKGKVVLIDTLHGTGYREIEVTEQLTTIFGDNELALRNGLDADFSYLNLDKNILNIEIDSITCYILTTDAVVVSNENGEIISEIALDIDLFNPIDITYYSGTDLDTGIYIVGEFDNGQSSLFTFQDGSWIDLSAVLVDNVLVNDLYNYHNKELWIVGNLQVQNDDGDEILTHMVTQRLDDFVQEDFVRIEFQNVEYLGKNENSLDQILLEYTLENLTDNIFKEVSITSLEPFFDGFCPGTFYENMLSLNAGEEKIVLDTLIGYALLNRIKGICLLAASADRLLDGDLSNSITCVSEVVNLEDFIIDQDIIYPNPVLGDLYIKGATQHQTFLIYNASGVLISKTKYSDGISTSSLPQGLYFIKNASNQVISKFVKL